MDMRQNRRSFRGGRFRLSGRCKSEKTPRRVRHPRDRFQLHIWRTRFPKGLTDLFVDSRSLREADGNKTSRVQLTLYNPPQYPDCFQRGFGPSPRNHQVCLFFQPDIRRVRWHIQTSKLTKRHPGCAKNAS